MKLETLDTVERERERELSFSEQENKTYKMLFSQVIKTLGFIFVQNNIEIFFELKTCLKVKMRSFCVLFSSYFTSGYI